MGANCESHGKVMTAVVPAPMSFTITFGMDRRDLIKPVTSTNARWMQDVTRRPRGGGRGRETETHRGAMQRVELLPETETNTKRTSTQHAGAFLCAPSPLPESHRGSNNGHMTWELDPTRGDGGDGRQTTATALHAVVSILYGLPAKTREPKRSSRAAAKWQAPFLVVPPCFTSSFPACPLVTLVLSLQRLVIKDNADEVSEWVAQYVVARIKGFAPTADKPFVLGLPTGSSPLAAYKKVRAARTRCTGLPGV